MSLNFLGETSCGSLQSLLFPFKQIIIKIWPNLPLDGNENKIKEFLTIGIFENGLKICRINHMELPGK